MRKLKFHPSWLAVALTVLTLAPVHSVLAIDLWGLNTVKNGILYIVSWILYYTTVFIFGWLSTFAIKLLVYVAGLNNFTDLPVILEAWQVVRDIANMMFIIIILVIAFGTLFRIEAYSWKKLLPKMVIAAILVNYSRAICGFLVDASQVVMLTFVAAIKDAASVGLIQAFQLDKLLQYGTVKAADENIAAIGQESDPTTRLVAIMAAGTMLGTMFIVQFVYIVVLVGRLVMIWFLTVLSPLAFASNVLPQTEKFSSQWWEMFTRYVIVGPLCMFFLWLAMFIAAKSIDAGGLGSVAATEVPTDDATAGSLDTTLVSGFIIATMMLMAGMKMAQQTASELGSAISQAEGVGKGILKFGAVAGAFVGGAAAKTAADKLYEGTGYDLNLSRQYHKIQHKREEIKRKREAIGYTKAFAGAQRGNIVKGWLGAADFAYEQYTPVMGKQGLWGEGTRGALTRWYGNSMFEKSKNEIKALQLNRTKASGDYAARKADLMGKSITVADKERKLKENQAAREQLDGVSADGKGWNMKADSASGAIARNVLADLQKKRNAATDQGEAKRLTAQIAALDAAIAKNEESVDIDLSGAPGLGNALNTARSKRLEDLKTERDGINAKENVFASQAAMDSFITSQTAAQKKKVDAVDDQIKGIKKNTAAKYAPVIDYEGTQAAEAVLAEERKKYAGEENEDVLRELIRAKLHEHDGVGALGVIEQAAQVGHLNEVLDEMGLDQSIDGMKKLAALVEAEGVDSQMVMAAMDQSSKSAKHINHWAFAEAVTQTNGTYEWRDDKTIRDRKYIEMSKAGMGNIARSGNRLAYGGYNSNREWVPDPAALQLLAQQMPNLGDAAGKGHLNNNAGEHIFTKYDGRYEKELREVITEMYGAGSNQETEAFKAMDKWKASTYNKARGHNYDDNMYSTAEKVAAKHRK